jgi:hypothetical protein
LIVDDFFGREWVRVFCGEQIASAIGGRLDANQVVAFRTSLRAFYGFVFNLHDPGIPIPPQPGTPSIPLPDRYVLPDVIATEVVTIAPTIGATDIRSNDPEGGGAIVREGDSANDRRSAPRMRPHFTRESVISWLSKSERSVVLGTPGSGKSSLLRYLVLDLMSDAPSLEPLASRWAQRLPVWVPFAFWTKLIASSNGEGASLLECIRRWFAQWNKDDLWPLVSGAIQDQRLLLVVDGLDEWTNEDAGRIGSQLLQAFVETHKVAVVVTSRPYGFRRLAAFSGQDWQSGELAPLSEEQRSALCRRWFLLKSRLDATNLDLDNEQQQSYAVQESERFRDELARSAELVQLGETPLLLVLLLYMKFQHAVLPRRRFDAYDRILDHLLRYHPAAKRAAAFVTDSTEPLSDSDIRFALAQLAFVLHSASDGSVIAENDVEDVIFRFLTDQSGLGLGLPPSAARSYLPQFSRVAEGSLGILVRQGVREVSFLHRSFQEFLASHHLSRLPLAEQERFIVDNGHDVRWREVFLGLVWRTRRPDDVEHLVKQLHSHAGHSASGLAARELLTEIAFGEFGCPPQTSIRLAEEAIASIERHWWMPHRRRLLAYCLDGLRSARLRDTVRQHLRRWVFSRGGWRASSYEAMDGWPATPDVTQFLMTRLYDEEARVQRTAARSLGNVARGAGDVGDEIAAMAH